LNIQQAFLCGEKRYSTTSIEIIPCIGENVNKINGWQLFNDLLDKHMMVQSEK